VNAVAPAVIETDMSNFTKTAAGRDLALGMQALKRIGKPDDLADVIAFLASGGARWVTGASKHLRLRCSDPASPGPKIEDGVIQTELRLIMPYGLAKETVSGVSLVTVSPRHCSRGQSWIQLTSRDAQSCRLRAGTLPGNPRFGIVRLRQRRGIHMSFG